ncbi:hypothetical protein GGI07_000683 [Coemansia sp. Benny D115]|nr:hypothetical protein GGI07_000683 [Coemansia sp. Benny D115]
MSMSMPMSMPMPVSESPTPRRRVRQLSSVRAWCQTAGVELGAESDSEVAGYQSFPDLRRLLDEECAEIERRELEAKASLEARIKRRSSDPHGDAASESPSSPGFIGSLYRLIDPIIPAGLAAAKASAGARATSG